MVRSIINNTGEKESTACRWSHHENIRNVRICVIIEQEHVISDQMFVKECVTAVKAAILDKSKPNRNDEKGEYSSLKNAIECL